MSSSKVRVWDAPTRLFHWSLVVLIVNAWLSQRYGAALGDHILLWHRINGYLILTLVVFRLLWGIWGGSTARFASFVRSPLFSLGYLMDLKRGKKRAFLGHNPLGTWMVLALLSIVAGEAILGLFALEHNGLTAGPLQFLIDDAKAEYLTKIHIFAFYGLILFIFLHVVANIFYSLIAKDPLIPAMVTGKKPARPHSGDFYEDSAGLEEKTSPLMRAALTLLLAGGIVGGVIMLLGGRLF